ncbi:hypothetical protein ACIRBX_24270 [Kitasatospora sp. NPDC096147]|uniref:hypothetical protein n=1 Tax=Kitasatospora sp. NPDC096147 TaxID=3364093 RepID=UPI003814F941
MTGRQAAAVVALVIVAALGLSACGPTAGRPGTDARPGQSAAADDGRAQEMGQKLDAAESAAAEADADGTEDG